MNKSVKILQQVKDGYNQIAEHFSQTRQAPWSEFTLFKQYIKDGQKILDAGCGNGRIFFSFLKDYNVEYHGIDNSERLIEIAVTKVSSFKLQVTNKSQILNPNPSASLGTSFQTADIAELPYPDNFFNLVFCIATFHHLPDKKSRLKALAEMRRVLKPGGYLLMTNWHLWHRSHLKYFFNQFLKKISWKDFFIPWKSSDGNVKCQRYYHGFTKDEIKRLFNKSDFKIEKIFFQQNAQKKECVHGIDIVTIGRK